jgi:hypothetical protein
LILEWHLHDTSVIGNWIPAVMLLMMSIKTFFKIFKQ